MRRLASLVALFLLAISGPPEGGPYAQSGGVKPLRLAYL